MQPSLDRIDHIHVFVSDRDAAVRWYGAVMGLRPTQPHAPADRGNEPLMLSNTSGSVHLALFERPAQPCRSTVAFAVGALGFVAWQRHLGSVLQAAVEPVNHGNAWSLYFSDPDGNPYEITSYDHQALSDALQRR